MTIDEIIAHCRQHGDGLKFRALPNQSFATNIIFTVVDAHFQFITYTGLDGQFTTVKELKAIGMTETRFEWVN